MAMDDGRVVSNFIVQALTNTDITVYGNGSQVTSFCYVDDLIRGLMALFFTENITGPINLGNPSPITMLELADEIISMTNSSSKVIYKPLPEDDPLTRQPDIARAINALSWNPRVTRKDGLRETINYFSTLLTP
jgi:UDP-glucuronate decarboxylase